MGEPVLVLISGHPSTGKTTLGLQLAQQFTLPFFYKDQFKELMYDVVADGDLVRLSLDVSRTLGRISIGCLELVMTEMLAKQHSVMLEANFDPRLFSPRVAQVQRTYPCRIVQVFLHADNDVLVERFIQREATDRHPGHQGLKYLDAIKEALVGREQKPLDVAGDLLIVDTTDFAHVDYTPVIELLRQRLAAREAGR